MKTSTPESLRARGVENLLYGDVEKAVGDLEQAAEISPQNAGLRSDLSAAYLVRAEERQRPDDLIRALSAALEANRLDPVLPEAVFNRALLSEKLFIRQQAIQAWKVYLKLDRGSEWGKEAERHLQALEKPTLAKIWPAEKKRLSDAATTGDVATVQEIVREAPQASREFVEEDLLGAWADAQVQGDLAGASRVLKAAEVIGGAVFEVTGDAMARDSVGVIRAAVDTADSGHLDRLVEGHLLFARGKKLYDALEMSASMEPLAKARKLLEESGSPFARWASLYYEVGVFRQGDLDAALPEFDTLSEGGGYPILQAHAKWMKGWILYQRGQFGRSIDLFDHSLAALEKSRQPQNVATLHLLNASNFTFLGEPLRAEAHLQLALGFISQVLKRRWAVTIFEEAAKAARINGYLLSSVQFLDEAVGVALQDGNPAVLNEALLSRALAHHELADTPAAVQDLQSAENWLDRIKDPPVHRLMEAQFLAARGEVLRESAPDRAIIDLSKALEDRSSSGMATETTALHLERGRAYLASRQLDKAEADFTAGIQAFEQHRRSVSEEQLRISYFDKAREIFDDMIALQIDVHHNSRQALEFSERARARELLDTVYGRPADGTSDIEAIRRNLPRDTQILYYVVLKNEILAWILSSKGSGFVRWHASSEELQRDNELLVRAMESGAPADQIEAAASKLYDALILPLGRGLIPSERLIIVPDKFLFTVPFSVLIDSRSHHYLVEEYAISVSPSLLLLSHALKRGALFDRPCAGRILVVGNPAFDRNRFPRLLRLPGSEEEARQIAAIYPDSKVLLDREATKTAFLDAAGQYEIVHFGGHAISNEEFPLLSRFVLAPDLRTGDGGSLLAHEIYGHRFPKTRLVVLAACSTARARVSPGEGALSLARPFLAAGVPSVVASLWDINDEQSRFLFDTFHRLVAEGLPPHQALHEAQIRIRRQNLHPSVWAAFEVIEGSS